MQEESADVWHTAGGTKLQKYQSEDGKKNNETILLSKEEEDLLKDALRQGRMVCVGNESGIQLTGCRYK